ncbi:Rpn family recombination-promoting nuclease/putative transposase [Desulfobacter latus]|uniref:Transposase (putative) YhgA-like domain-containing protein n=1 Tax=Desulfobacter latus TaxID=2292 RepID=A0A850T1G2_9BACT|nr:hypothetical protein [Desulfobacter latus]NWH04931.1 hypothetical protein [Desulfobacter latus]
MITTHQKKQNQVMNPHDHNFKNLFLDFPKEALAWLFPEAEQNWGQVINVEFVRQEPKKHSLSDKSLELDMPILFHFEHQQLLLWLVEFQEDKGKFSIYKLLRYTTDLMEAYPQALVIPTVLFTDEKRWRKSVLQHLHTQLNDRLFLHFEYVFHKLFDLNARDYYNINNPVVKILLPKMRYKKEERIDVIRQAYTGLYQLVSSGLFDKYVDFIDTYAGIGELEQQELYNEIVQHKDTAMLSEYIRNKGIEQGIEQGIIQKAKKDIIDILRLRFGKVPHKIVETINRTDDLEILDSYFKQVVQINGIDQLRFF